MPHADSSPAFPSNFPSTLLIVCAIRPEAAAIASRMVGARRFRIAGFPCHRGTLAGAEAILVRARAGPEFATQGAAAAVDEIKPDLLINFGTAGAINDDLQTGDCLLSAAAVAYDPADIEHGAETGEKIRLAEPLRKRVEALGGVKLAVFGSADYTVRDDETRARLRERFGIDAVDWETYSVLSLAQERNIPAFAFRVVTDLAGPGAEQEFLEGHKRRLATAAERLVELLAGLRQGDKKLE